MAVKYTRPKGTQDILPNDSWKWQYLEGQMHAAAQRFGFREIRLPTFESTEVFARGVGEGTDIVSKEMYTFEDKGGRSVTLRPEGTAGVVRAVLENGLLAASPLPLKSYYIQSFFRYENSQKGRYREFHQFGVECFGTKEAAADAEVMALAASVLQQFGIAQGVSLQINSIGCPACRPAYLQALRSYYEGYKEQLCPTCRQRLATNPMRLLDCKEDACKKIAKDAPKTLDYLCEECETHFHDVQEILSETDTQFEINPMIVRGLDYYTKTVFEFVADGIGTQGTVCAGGRYDGLIDQLGGAPTPAVGFGMGMERLLMILENEGRLPVPPPGPALYVVAQSPAGYAAARKLTNALRQQKVAAECDVAQRSVKAQMKAAGRLGALYTIVLGDEELASGIVVLKRMHDGAVGEMTLVGTISTFKYLLAQDPRAQSVEPLDDLIQTAGPLVLFEDGENG